MTSQAILAEENFINQFQKKNIPNEIEEVSISISKSSIPLTNLLKDCGMTSSTSEAMRMIKQGAVRIDEHKITDTKHIISAGYFSRLSSGEKKI
jgi:tyrosyl-tRNA synthetase